MFRKSKRWSIIRFALFLGMLAVTGYTIAVSSGVSRAEPALEAHSQGTEHQFLYQQFTPANTAGLSLVGQAQVLADDTVLRLTSTTPCCQASAAWYRTRQHVADGFDTTFDFQVSNGGADGLAFVIHNDNDGLETVGTGGCSMGYGDISKAVVIEFDTYQNGFYCAENQDPNDNHIGIISGGTGVVQPRHTIQYNLATETLPSSINLKQGFHTARVRYVVPEAATTGILEVYINDLTRPFLTTTLNLETKIGLTDGTAWVGFMAGTGTTAANHDIANWFFVDNWDISCLEYDFTLASNAAQTFIPDPYQDTNRSARWPLNSVGWESINGHLSISRGLINTTPVFRTDDRINQRLVTILREQHPPIEAVNVHFSWHTVEGSDVKLSDTIQVSFILKTATHSLQGQQTFTRSQLTLDPQTNYFVARVPLRDVDIANANDPSGLKIVLDTTDTSQIIRLKKAGACFDAGVPDRPYVIPPGATKACDDLKANLLTRSQPFGSTSGQGEQPEFPFATTTDVDLIPYTYTIGINGYPDLMSYDTMPPGHAAVACAFTQNGQIYNPADPNTPVIRFTALGSDQYWRESLTILNYAAFFSQTLKQWCANGDNVYSNIWDRTDFTLYTAGYNVPAPRYTCTPTGALYTGLSFGPCGTFVGSLYRAMGYFNVPAFAAAIGNAGTASVIGNLYYGPVGYNRYALNDNAYHSVQNPLVRVNTINPRIYQPEVVSFEGIRIYPHQNGARIYGDGLNAYSIGWEWWSNPGATGQTPIAEIVPSPRDPVFKSDPQTVYRSIKPGDIVITVVENHGPDAVPASDIDLHISIVVGWGPQQFNTGAWMGYNLFPTYTSIPQAERDTFVPYVMDRFSVPGTGSTAGPRPFNYRISHTATDIWVSSHAMPIQSVASYTNQAAATDTFIQDISTTQLQTSSGTTPTVQSWLPDSTLAGNPVDGSLIIGGPFGLRATDDTLAELTPWPAAAKSVVDLAWNHAGTLLASAEAAQYVVIRDAQGNVKAHLNAHRSAPTAVAWHPQDTLLASSGRNGQVLLWDTSLWQPERTLPYTGSSFIQNLTWNSDGSLLAGNDYHHIWIWNTTSGEVERRLELTTSPRQSLHWTTDDQAFVLAGGIRLNAETGIEEGFAVQCSSGTDTLALLSPDGTRLLGAGGSASSFEACIHTLDEAFEVQATTYLQTPINFEAITDLAWNADMQQVALVTRHGWVSIWDSTTGEIITVAARPEATVHDVQDQVMTCVYDDGAQLALLYHVEQGNYAQFIAEVQAHADQIDLACQQYLIALATYLSNNPPLADSDEQPTQLPALGAWCAPDANHHAWTILNPNAFDIVIGWGWADQAPALVEEWIVVPAASNGQPGRWHLRTPVGTSNLRVVSGDIELNATWDGQGCQQVVLPFVRLP